MRFLVRDLLKLSTMKDAAIIAGEKGLDNEITGITIIEAPDIAIYINGGEVLLTSLYPFIACSAEEYEEYVRQLCKKKISAMILKVGRKIESSEKLKAFLVTELEKHCIPVIEIPLGVAYKDITYPVMERLFNEEATKLKYFKETHDRFISLSLSPPFAVNGFRKILYSLSELIGNPVALFDKNLSCIVTTDKKIDTLTIPENPQKIDHRSYSKYEFFGSSTIYGESGDKLHYQIIVPLNNMTFNMDMSLVITELNSEIDQLDYIAIENAIMAILLEFTKHRAFLEREKEFKNSILEQILNGKIRSRDKLNLNANLLGLPIDASYYVLVFSVSDEKIKKAADYNTQIRFNRILYEAISQYFDNIHVQNNSNDIVVLQEADGKQSTESYMKEVRAKAEKVRHSVCGSKNNCVVNVGIGNLAEGVANIPNSFKEANDTLFLIETVETLAGGHGSRVAFFSDLGILKLFTYLNDPAVLNNFVPESLKKLYKHKSANRDDLITTLQTYLNNRQNTAKTAQDLFVHYKTIAYRVNKIASITGIDFDNAEQVLSAQIGLIILKLTENYNDSRM